jgi:hypothetical protein
MTFDWFDFLLPTLVALLVAFLGWSQMRVIGNGRPLTLRMKRILLYAFLFVLGMGYVMFAGSVLSWPRAVWFSLIAAWALTLALGGWWRHRRSHLSSDGQSAVVSGQRLKVTLPMIGLLFCLIGNGIEWELVVEGRGHLLVALLWIAAGGAMIVIARRNRRVTVVVASRSFLGLLILGALLQQNTVALAAAGVGGLGLFLVERLWRPSPPSEIHVDFAGR